MKYILWCFVFCICAPLIFAQMEEALSADGNEAGDQVQRTEEAAPAVSVEDIQFPLSAVKPPILVHEENTLAMFHILGQE